MKIYEIHYCIKCTVGKGGWYDIPNNSICVSASSAELAIAAAKKTALLPQKFKDDETGKMTTERYKNFDITSVKLLAEADIKA